MKAAQSVNKTNGKTGFRFSRVLPAKWQGTEIPHPILKFDKGKTLTNLT